MHLGCYTLLLYVNAGFHAFVKQKGLYEWNIKEM